MKQELIREQLNQLRHVQAAFASRPHISLAEALTELQQLEQELGPVIDLETTIQGLVVKDLQIQMGEVRH